LGPGSIYLDLFTPEAQQVERILREIKGLQDAVDRKLEEAEQETKAIEQSIRNTADEHKRVMDRYHKQFDVYTDVSVPGSHFFEYAKFPGADALIGVNGSWTDRPHSSATALRVDHTAGESFAGVYLQNGTLRGKETSPSPNFGVVPGAGIDLSGAVSLTFWARGERGDEKGDFFMGGVGRDTRSGTPVAPYPDSSPRIPAAGSPLVSLSTDWKQYTISLQGKDLSYVLGGFGFALDDAHNPEGATLYIDDVQFQLGADAQARRLAQPRFLASYATGPFQNLPAPVGYFDLRFRNAAFTYDEVLAELAFLADGSPEGLARARQVGDAFVYAMDHDRTFTDGQVRSLYAAGDIALPPGWEPNGRQGTVPAPGFYDEATQAFVGLWTTGDDLGVIDMSNNAWVMIGLEALYERTHDVAYLDSARRVGEYILGFRNDSGTYRGFPGGIDRAELDTAKPRGWASTEHNIDIFAAFTTMHRLTGEARWLDGATHAMAFVESMWDPSKGAYLTGTSDPEHRNEDPNHLPVDVQAWSALALPGTLALHPQVLSSADTNQGTQSDGAVGYDFNNDKDGVWFEGTAQMSVALAHAGQADAARVIRENLARYRASAPFGDGGGIVAATHDGVSTGFFSLYGFPISYYRRLHIGATAWTVFAQLGSNPYYQAFDDPAPDSTVVTNTNDSGAGSLRQAILNANNHPGLDTVSFAIAGPGVHTIRPATALPAITDSVIIDGYTQPGASPNTRPDGNDAILRIELDGSSAGTSASGLVILASRSLVRGLAIGGFAGPVGVIGATQGIGILASNASGVIIAGNFIGTDATGTIARPNANGVTFGRVTASTIGGGDPAARNIISGNWGRGIEFNDLSTGNLALGNFVGTTAAGTGALGNGADGVITFFANNTIGGPAAGARNVISGNGTGISIYGSNASGAVVQGNLIGTDVTGADRLGNANNGIFIHAADGYTIGGTETGAGNLVSGNGGNGIVIAYSLGAGGLVAGNRIGTDITGTRALGNSGSGVRTVYASNLTLGGAAAGAGNLISADLIGVFLDGAGSVDNRIRGNLIGPDVTGAIALGNAQYGVELFNVVRTFRSCAGSARGCSRSRGVWAARSGPIPTAPRSPTTVGGARVISCLRRLAGYAGRRSRCGRLAGGGHGAIQQRWLSPVVRVIPSLW